MSDHNEHKEEIGEEKETLMDKIADKLHLPHNHHESAAAHDDRDETSTLSSSSSDDEADKTAPAIPPAVPVKKEEEPSPVKAKVNRLFGREKPVHQVLGGGKTADVFLWRDKKVSASVLGTATVIWVLFELLEYHLLALICHISIFTLAGVFLWANASTLLHKTEPKIPEVRLPERALVDFASAVTFELNRGLALLRDIASGKELKKFLGVIAGLWLLSLLGSSCNFLTLFYIAFVVLHTLPALYEKHEDKVDSYAERAAVEVRRQYSLVNEKYLSKVNEKCLSKIPKVPLKDKKTA